MAKSKATYVTRGYGQVEPNHLSAPRNGQVYAQLPAAATIDLLENGQFVKYDYANGVCNFSAEKSAGAWMMVFNEVKVYDDRETEADFAMVKQNYDAHVYNALGQAMPEGTKMVPRVFYISIGDIWTTNTVMADPGTLTKGALLKIGGNGS